MDHLSVRYLMWAITLGALSAMSLPLGSAVGLLTRLKPILISIFAAFGAGALIAALTVELVAPTLFALHDESGGSHGGDPYLSFYALVAGAVVGGIAYVMLDRLVNAHGGFLRKTAITMIAAAMIPEAVHQGDANAVGLSTLAGFLVAISFKLLE